MWNGFSRWSLILKLEDTGFESGVGNSSSSFCESELYSPLKKELKKLIRKWLVLTADLFGANSIFEILAVCMDFSPFGHQITQMSISDQSSEKAFVSTYTKLMHLSANATSDQFYSTADYAKLSTLGPSLPLINLRMPDSIARQETSIANITVTIKSIKPPFKFMTPILEINPATCTVFKLKSQLIMSLRVIFKENLSEQDIKLMLKSKVLQDSTILLSLDADLTTTVIGCIVTAPTPVATNKAERSHNPGIIGERAWQRILSILKEEISDSERVLQIYTSFRAGIEDTINLD